MEKRKYNIWQKINRVEIYILIGFLTLLFVYRLIREISVHNHTTYDWTVLLTSMIVLALGWWFVLTFRIQFRLGPKSLTISTNSFFSGKQKIRWKDIENIEFVEIPEAAMWSGWGVHFALRQNYWGFCDRRLTHITLKNGQECFISSNALYRHRDELLELLATKAK